MDSARRVEEPMAFRSPPRLPAPGPAALATVVTAIPSFLGDLDRISKARADVRTLRAGSAVAHARHEADLARIDEDAEVAHALLARRHHVVAAELRQLEAAMAQHLDDVAAFDRVLEAAHAVLVDPQTTHAHRECALRVYEQASSRRRDAVARGGMTSARAFAAFSRPATGPAARRVRGGGSR